MSHDKILVPLDGSAFAESSLPAAIGMAQSLGATIELVTVFEDQPFLSGTDLTAQKYKTWLAQYLHEVVARVARISDVAVSFVIIDGQPSKRLVEHAKRSHADLMVMSTHGRGALSRAWLGSVADHVLKGVAIPILLVRADESGSTDLSRNIKLNHVIAAVDGSELAEQSLGWAARIAKQTGATLTLLRAVEPPTPLASADMAPAMVDFSTTMRQDQEDAEAYLSGLGQRLRDGGIKVETRALAGSHPAQGILDFSLQHDVDLIIIATHGRTGVARLVLGSVADKVVRGSHTAVLLIHPLDQPNSTRDGAVTRPRIDERSRTSTPSYLRH